ncbi:MAG: efflux RND transporter periplasmic adaptor subunit [Proteobacteria bacterium]|nr:efflux RND transporter periplasmic adaptor subunit [Pseudomonadota bacterium]
MNKNIRNRLIIFIVIIIAIGLLIWNLTKPAQPKKVHAKSGTSLAAAAIVVKVVHPERKDAPVTIQEIASVEPEQSVNVVSQVSGVLKKIYIDQGQNVSAGQLLFEIDPGVYATDVANAEAVLKRDQAQLAFQKATADRYAALAKLEYVSKQKYEDALASAQEQESVVAADQAQLQQKKIQLGYTRIHAPISGKAGAINFHVGDIIVANGATPLVVINRLDNVLVSFNVPQNQLQDLLTYQQTGSLKIQVLNESGNQLLAEGQLNFIGNAVNPQTGTILVKGKIDNTGLKLWPGQLVLARLILKIEHNALVIPSMAVQMGQNGNYVYVVRNNQAAIQPITVDRVQNGETVVSQGIDPKDEIIAETPPGLQEGVPVKVSGQK